MAIVDWKLELVFDNEIKENEHRASSTIVVLVNPGTGQ
jgi:hypothetical protein